MHPPSPALVGENVSTVDLCPACSHPLISHDPISLRWCAATRLGVGHRECLCVSVVPPARVLRHY